MRQLEKPKYPSSGQLNRELLLVLVLQQMVITPFLWPVVTQVSTCIALSP